MPDPKFKGTHPKIDTANQCVTELSAAWWAYTTARIVYAEAMLHHNWSHHGNKRREDLITNATMKISDAYDDYLEKIDTFKRAHAAYKTAIRELLRGHLL
ncbi:hypothetical protein LCGC14_0363770 [marine sediment metagenome]|uniref:Uncharacterized protein n=1 Tax=marine sediment metagenome TaxID=412755 RepID=A0A0F9WFH7_9ZZZZ